MGIQSLRDGTPYFPQVLLAVLGEESREGRLLGEGPGLVVGRLEGVDFPLRNCVTKQSVARGGGCSHLGQL